MPELPDIVVYIDALERRILGHTLERIEIAGPFLLRTATPPIESASNHKVVAMRRLGKRIAIGLKGDETPRNDPSNPVPGNLISGQSRGKHESADTETLWLVLHLMIAGRLHWTERRVKPDGRRTLAAFHFDSGTLTLTEAGARKRASLHLVRGDRELEKFDRGGIEVLAATPEEFARVLTSANHTLKRSLTDPRFFSGIGNAYSDEILFHAQLSPVTLTQRISAEEIGRLYRAARQTLMEWIERLRSESGLQSGTVAGNFPEKVTAFRPQMAVHGRYGEPCPRCGAKVQRIRYASNETNYCALCQTGGKLLADRSLSRLLRDDWPRSLEELEERRLG